MSPPETGHARTPGAHGSDHPGGADDVELHLPHGSIWPILMAIAVSVAAVGIAIPLLLPIGVVLILGALAGWVKEDTKWWDEHIGTGEGAGRLGVILFMSSEIFLFGALFATYFSFKAASGHWPDTEVHLPLLKTFIFSLFLFASSGTVHMAEKHLHAGNHKAFLQWWGATIALGAIFLGGQVNEYMTLISEGAVLGSGHFVTTFYMITGTHGLHVLAGIVALIVVFIRGLKGQFNQKRNLAPLGASMYWHFVDAIWVVVFTVLYIFPFLLHI